jgi:hypothetical protein
MPIATHDLAERIAELERQIAFLTNLQQFAKDYEYGQGVLQFEPPRTHQGAMNMLGEAVMHIGKVIATTADPMKRAALAEAALRVDAALEKLIEYIPNDGI